MRIGRRGTVLALGALLLQAFGADGAQAEGPQVTTRLGTVEGRWIAGEPPVAAFLGIPYAEAPEGARRWLPPVPAAPWEGVRPARELGPACPQSGLLTRLHWPLYRAYGVPDAEVPYPRRVAEDCLVLNVWTPALAPAAPLPVVVVLHGGGFSSGSASEARLDGAGLAREGVVVVTLNHRLGVLGFFLHPALEEEARAADRPATNLGLLDQIQALLWVQDHIAAFGGDPARVTLAGQGAGGTSVAILMTTPFADGLFHRALIQGAGELHDFLGRDAAQAVGAAFAARLGAGPDAAGLAALRARAAGEVVGAAILPFGIDPHQPVIDGRVLAEQPARTFLDLRQAPVPLIIGSTADEASLYAFLHGERDPASHRAMLERRFGAQAARLLELYPIEEDGAVLLARRRLETDLTFGCTARFLAESHAALGAPVHLYHLERAPAGPGAARFGAFQGADLLHLLDSFPPSWPLAPEDVALGRTLRTLVASFARGERPAAPDLPDWPAFDLESGMRLVLGDTPTIAPSEAPPVCGMYLEAMLDRIDDPLSP